MSSVRTRKESSLKTHEENTVTATLHIGRLTTLAFAFALVGVIPAAAQAPGREAACDFKALGAAVAADTAHLRRTQLDFDWAEATAGASLTLYGERAAPKVVVLGFLGELGRTRNTYYLVDRRNFVLERDELRYAVPTDVEAHSRIISRLPTVVYFCSGVAQARADSVDFRRFAAQLDSALATAKRSGR